MIQTINQTQVIKELNTINQSILNICNYFSDIDTYPVEKKLLFSDSIIREEKRLDLLLANRSAYKKMLLKTITN